MRTNRKVPDQDYHIIDTKSIHLTVRKKVMKDAFARMRCAIVKTEMYSPIPVSDKFSIFDIPAHEDERLTLIYMLKRHILDKGLSVVSVCHYIHSTCGNRVIFLTICINTNMEKRSEESDNHRSRLLNAITLCISIAPNREIKKTLNEFNILLKKYSGTTNYKGAQKVHKLLNDGS